MYGLSAGAVGSCSTYCKLHARMIRQMTGRRGQTPIGLSGAFLSAKEQQRTCGLDGKLKSWTS